MTAAARIRRLTLTNFRNYHAAAIAIEHKKFRTLPLLVVIHLSPSNGETPTGERTDGV